MGHLGCFTIIVSKIQSSSSRVNHASKCKRIPFSLRLQRASYRAHYCVTILNARKLLKFQSYGNRSVKSGHQSWRFDVCFSNCCIMLRICSNCTTEFLFANNYLMSWIRAVQCLNSWKLAQKKRPVTVRYTTHSLVTVLVLQSSETGHIKRYVGPVGFD